MADRGEVGATQQLPTPPVPHGSPALPTQSQRNTGGGIPETETEMSTLSFVE